MEAIIMGYVGTTFRIHSFIPGKPKASVRFSEGCICRSDELVEAAKIDSYHF